jgi:hypothetical protein
VITDEEAAPAAVRELTAEGIQVTTV